MKQDMAKYFANDLRQVATAEIEQMIPIFRTIQLTPESMPVPDYPLPGEQRDNQTHLAEHHPDASHHFRWAARTTALIGFPVGA